MSALVPKVTRELAKMKRTLRDVFGLDQLRPGQAKGNTVCARREKHAGHYAYRSRQISLLPTTGAPHTGNNGNSLAANFADERSVDKLEEAGLEASQVNSALTTSEHQQNLEQIKTESTNSSSLPQSVLQMRWRNWHVCRRKRLLKIGKNWRNDAVQAECRLPLASAARLFWGRTRREPVRHV